MNDLTDLVPMIAKALGFDPATLLAYVMLITTVANVCSRLIPDTATGWLKTVKSICAVIGVHVSNRVAPGVSQADVAKAALETPPIPDKVEAAKAEDAGDQPAP